MLKAGERNAGGNRLGAGNREVGGERAECEAYVGE